MADRFEDLWNSAANDGASTPFVPFATDTDAELEQLMTAWYHERTERIEFALLLDRAEGLIDKMLALGEVSPRTRKQALRFLRASRDSREKTGRRDNP
jgi:hypothetical protein